MIPVELIKMLINEDVGNNFINVLIGLFLFAIAYFAWRSTSIREHRSYHAVLLLETRLRRRLNHLNRSRLTTHIESASIVTGVQSEVASGSGENPSQNNAQTIETNKPSEGSSSSSSEETGTQNIESIPTGNTFEEQEIEAIVEIMDADANEVRRRRLAYYENRQHGALPTHIAEHTNDQHNSNPAIETMDHSEQNTNEPIMEHNYAERDVIEIDTNDKNNDTEATSTTTTSDSITIKLKYLNDELKLVDGHLKEQLGDFKRRHFHPEFSSNKLVRLIFNGQVLQTDSETLQSCGLFDNCVVHCLIHQQRNVSFESNSNSPGVNISRSYSGNNNDQGSDWNLSHVLFILVSVILTFAWYFRYQYAYLYNVTATVALVAMTGIFTIFVVGVYFPDNEQARVPRQ